MLNNITIGAYYPQDSVLHRLNPVAKIIALTIVLVAIFLIRDISLYLISIFLLSILVSLSKIPFILLLKSMKPFVIMISFVMIFNLFIIKEGEVLFEIIGFPIYLGALTQTIIIFLRLTTMIVATSLLTLTTKPMDLTFGIEQVLKPLKKVNFPAHEVAMMISIALRFIPTLIEETNKIIIAQTSRGVDFESKKIKVKVAAVVSLLIPLFVASFKRAEELAYAMEARGYNPSAVRTRFVINVWKVQDTIAILLASGYLGVLLWYITIK